MKKQNFVKIQQNNGRPVVHNAGETEESAPVREPIQSTAKPCFAIEKTRAWAAARVCRAANPASLNKNCRRESFSD